MSIVILLGPPGSGKGTQAELLEKDNGFLRLSTGDLLRKEIADGTEYGKKVQTYLDKGLLVPDEIVTKFILDYIEKNELYKKQVVFDGFPRRISQAEALRDKLKEFSKDIDTAILIDLPEEEIIKRLTSRKVCPECRKVFPGTFEGNTCEACGSELTVRSDDNEETIRKRLDVYSSETSPLIDYFDKAGMLDHISGKGSVEEIKNRIKALVM